MRNAASGAPPTSSDIAWAKGDSPPCDSARSMRSVIWFMCWNPRSRVFEYERNYLEGESRTLAALDDDTVAVLDANPIVAGARVRVIRFPTAA